MAGELEVKNWSNLPEPIKDWLSSPRLTYILIDLNRQLGIREAKMIVIPQLIAELAMGEVHSRDFANELSRRLNLSPSSAKIIAKEVEEKALHPIEQELKNELGIDVALLHFPAEEQGMERVTRNMEHGAWSMEQKVEEIKPLVEPKMVPPPASGLASPIGGPLIIHAEREEVKPPIMPPRPTFSIRIPLNQKKYMPPAPIKARIETGDVEYETRNIEQGTRNTKQEIIKPILPPLGPLSSLSGLEHGARSMEQGVGNKKQEKSLPLRVLPLEKGEASVTADPFVKKVVNYSEWRTPLN